MKNILYAIIALFGVLAAVVTASILLSSSLGELEEKIDAYKLDSDPDYDALARDFSALRDEFGVRTATLSLLVSDDALIEIEHSFSDVIGYATARSYDGVITSVGRLQIALEHLRELAGLNIKSVF